MKLNNPPARILERKVASRVEAWIETTLHKYNEVFLCVASRVEAWIETKYGSLAQSL